MDITLKELFDHIPRRDRLAIYAILARSKNSTTRDCVPTAATYYGDPLPDELFHTLIADPDWGVRWSAYGLIEDFAPRKAIPVLLELLKTEQNAAAWAVAISVLAEFDWERATKVVLELLPTLPPNPKYKPRGINTIPGSPYLRQTLLFILQQGGKLPDHLTPQVEVIREFTKREPFIAAGRINYQCLIAADTNVASAAQ
jgi:hypothetical protein